MNALRKLWRRLLWRPLDRRGATAVEFALIGPIFIGLLIVAIDLGRYLWMKNSVEYAVDSAGRWAMVHETTTNFSSSDVTNQAVAYSPSTSCNWTATQVSSPYNGVTIDGSCPFSSMAGIYFKAGSAFSINSSITVPLQ